jgi:hypothetical protein
LHGVLQPWHEPDASPLLGIPYEQLTAVLQKGLSSEFGVDWRLAALSACEAARADALQRGYLVEEA